MSLEKNSVVECTIESLAYGGRGVAHVDGMAVFVAGALPGDVVNARIVRSKKRFAEGVAEQVVTPSVHRVEPRCAHFGECGGCAMQDLAYPEQLAQKGAQVESALARIGGVESLVMDDPVASPAIWQYRNKMEFAFEQRGDGVHLGLRGQPPAGAKGLGPVVDLTECHLCAERDIEVMRAVREFCRETGVPAYDPKAESGFWRHLVIRHTLAGESQIHLITSGEESSFALARELGTALMDRFPELASFVHSSRIRRSTLAFGENVVFRLGHKFVEERVAKGDGAIKYHLSPNAFFQTNTAGAAELFATISRFGGFTGSEMVLDLYCGIGAIGVYLADEVGSVVGYEISEESVGKAWASTKLNGLRNCEFFALSLDQGIDGVDRLPTPDVVVVDPPRSGMQGKAVESILALAPPKIIAVSCDPATLARDVKRLSDRYALVRAQAVDMFPHTHHVETVALLERR